jgi:REP element-mobilizing transposase RayT
MGGAMVIAYHVIFSTYGFWLPNDPRGSWSDFVGAWELVRFGKATKVSTTWSVAAADHDRRLRREAKAALEFPPVAFTGKQALAIGRGFAQAINEGGYALHACTVLPEHVHMVLGQSARSVGRIVGHLKGRATQRLAADGLWPDAARPVWGRKCWKVFLRSPEDVRRAIAYVEANPEKEGKPRQHWSFVRPFAV